MAKEAIRGAALALALVAGAGAAPSAIAQDLPLPGEGFNWERVGDVGIDVFDLAFGPDGTLWATASAGPHRLDLSGGFPGVWVLLVQTGAFSGAILPLGGDTLVAGVAGALERSLDGGLTWEEVYDEKAEELYEVPAGLPHAGRLLAAQWQGLFPAYSDDRGATWTPMVVPDDAGYPVGGEAFVALPTGRIVAGTFYGASLSDDGGATFRESGFWLWGHDGEQITATERSGTGGSGSPAVLMGGRVSAQAYARAWTSEDDGQTWGPGTAGHSLPEALTIEGGVEGMAPLGGASALLVGWKGTVYRTDDGGQTWVAVGAAPEVNDDRYVRSAVVGPDGRLYVGLGAQGTERGWVWRTNEVVVASEPGVPEPSEEPLRVEVHPNPAHDSATVTFTLRTPSEVEAVLYDGLGRRVAVLHEGPLGAGEHTLPLDGGALPAGVYVVRVAAGGAVATRTVTLLR
jgi:photosystem II stability/assembly factor-like uncharacterized protein